MTNDELDRLAALAAAATPGPWINTLGRVHSADTTHIANGYEDDCEFIAAARDAVPALVAEVRRLRGLVRDAYIEADMGWRMEGTDTIDAQACFLESAACKALDGAA